MTSSDPVSFPDSSWDSPRAQVPLVASLSVRFYAHRRRQLADRIA